MLTVSRRPDNNVPFKISIDTAGSQGCSCIFDVTQLKFSGGITGDILNLLRKVISSPYHRSYQNLRVKKSHHCEFGG